MLIEAFTSDSDPETTPRIRIEVKNKRQMVARTDRNFILKIAFSLQLSGFFLPTGKNIFPTQPVYYFDLFHSTL